MGYFLHFVHKYKVFYVNNSINHWYFVSYVRGLLFFNSFNTHHICVGHSILWLVSFPVLSVWGLKCTIIVLLGQGLLGQGENGELSSSHKCDIINLVPINRSMTSSKEWEMNLDRNWENRHIIKYFLIKHAKNEMNKCFVVYITILNSGKIRGEI